MQGIPSPEKEPDHCINILAGGGIEIGNKVVVNIIQLPGRQVDPDDLLCPGIGVKVVDVIFINVGSVALPGADPHPVNRSPARNRIYPVIIYVGMGEPGNVYPALIAGTGSLDA